MTGTPDRLSAPAGASPFSRPLVADDVPDAGLARAIEADPEECAAVAAEIGLPALRKLSAQFEIVWQSGRLHVKGTVAAAITQVCVVSLEPFDSEVTQAVDVTFAPPPPPFPGPRQSPAGASRRREPAARDQAREAPPPVHVAEGEADPPDPIVEGRIDLGAVAVEFLTLALDFYPRKPGVSFSDVVVGETGDEKPSAFAALDRLKDRS